MRSTLNRDMEGSNEQNIIHGRLPTLFYKWKKELKSSYSDSEKLSSGSSQVALNKTKCT